MTIKQFKQGFAEKSMLAERYDMKIISREDKYMSIILINKNTGWIAYFLEYAKKLNTFTIVIGINEHVRLGLNQYLKWWIGE